jgi:3-hydroxyacyl-[acyl-carrier-protein] dehydratase
MSVFDNRRPRLPHGAPFLLLDHVVAIEERRGVFRKLVTAADPCLDRDGVLPAAFVLEALAQAGGALVAEQEQHERMPGYLAGIDDFRLHAPVRAGDSMQVEVEIVRVFAGAWLFKGRALVDGELRAEGRFTLAQPR